MPIQNGYIDWNRYEPVDTSGKMVTSPPTDPEPGMSQFLKSPLPPFNSGPDNQRQFYYRDVPQYRIIPPPSNPTTIVQQQTTNTTQNVSNNNQSVINTVQFGVKTISSTQTPTFDLSSIPSGGMFVMAMGAGNITAMTISHATSNKGNVYTIKLTGVTGRTAVWAASLVNPPVTIDQGQTNGIFWLTFQVDDTGALFPISSGGVN